VKFWRAGSEAVLQRVTAEARSGRSEVDLMQNNSPENEAAHREKLLQEVRTPLLKDLIAAATPAHGEWVGITQDIWSAAYHTASVKKEELPKSYLDLQDPKWKGRLGIEANNHIWFGTLMGELGEEQGSKIFNNIVNTNGISARKGHSLLTVLVASGEVPLALTVYSWNPEQLKQKNAPIEGLLLPPLIGQASGIAMLKRAPNPASALLLHEFLIGEGQKLLADASFVPTSKKIPTPFGNLPVKFVDPVKALEMNDKWLKNFDEMIVKRAK
jgi:iron(III) transport system substrate-binding protein